MEMNNMAVQHSVATVTITGASPMTHSHLHDTPKFEGERPDDYEKRTWRNKLNVRTIDKKRTVVIPAHGMMQCIAAAAKYSKRQIPGQGKATWTAKFASGITIVYDPVLNIDPDSDQISAISILAHVDGIRGSGKRVIRYLPIIYEWSTTFEVLILDPIITKQVFHEMLELAGMFIGLHQFRPQNGGTNGRFIVDKILWQDRRNTLAA